MAGGIIERSELQGSTPTTEPGLIPVEYSTQIIQEAAKTSLALSTFRHVQMPTKVSQLPVLDVLPQAQWVTGEADASGGGAKAVTSQAWKGKTLTAEEIAAIVVIPEAVLEDASIDLWAEVTPRIAEAIGAAVDAAAFAGTNKPTSWPNGIIPEAVAAGNVTVSATPSASDYNDTFGLVEADGYTVRNVYAALDQKANFRGWNANGVPVFLTDIRDDGRVDSIYGVPVSYDETGAFDATTKAVVGDARAAILGTRTDMQVKVLSEATIDLGGGNSVNLAQQDAVALRVRARFAFQVANPVTVVEDNGTNRYPFAAIRTA